MARYRIYKTFQPEYYGLQGRYEIEGKMFWITQEVHYGLPKSIKAKRRLIQIDKHNRKRGK